MLTAPISTSLFPERNVACGLRIFRPNAKFFLPGDDGLWSRVVESLEFENFVRLEDFVCGRFDEDEKEGGDVALLVFIKDAGKPCKGELGLRIA